MSSLVISKTVFSGCRLGSFIFLSLGNTWMDAHILKNHVPCMAKEIICSVQMVTTNTLSTTKVCFHLLFLFHLIKRVTDQD